LLARLLIRQPTIILLDEPTAAMDEATERQFITRFNDWAADRTVVIATHRMRILDLVERIVVFDNGQVALDDRKDAALKVLQGVKKVVPANRPGNRQAANEESRS
jgi:ATP-binding cassette subfamily C protein LapB